MLINSLVIYQTFWGPEFSVLYRTKKPVLVFREVTNNPRENVEDDTKREMTSVSGVEQIREKDMSNLGAIYMGKLRIVQEVTLKWFMKK